MNKKVRFFCLALLCASLTFVACNQITTVKNGDPALTLELLEICDMDAKSGSVPVDKDKKEITSSDITAVFSFGTLKNIRLPVTVLNGMLDSESTTIELFIPAVKNEFKEWSMSVKATKVDYCQPLKIKSLKIFGTTVEKGYIEIEADKKQISETDITATFDYGDKHDESIPVVIKGAVPYNFIDGTNIVTLFVSPLAQTHKAWKMKVAIWRMPEPQDCILINPPAAGIIGAEAPSDELPDSDPPDFFQGVFIKGRTVILKPFEMAETETTYLLWAAVYDWATNAARGQNKYTFANPGANGSTGNGPKTQPVTIVSWRDAIIWCNAYTEMMDGNENECVYRDNIGKVLRDATANDIDDAVFQQDKKGFRLPTEAEWEYAARAGADGVLAPLTYFSGADDAWRNVDACDKVAWYDKILPYTAEVKKLAPNQLELYDMSGNVFEWCWDWFGSIEPRTETDPMGAPKPTKSDNQKRVERGGGWDVWFGYCLPGVGLGLFPETVFNDLGFRICRYQ